MHVWMTCGWETEALCLCRSRGELWHEAASVINVFTNLRLELPVLVIAIAVAVIIAYRFNRSRGQVRRDTWPFIPASHATSAADLFGAFGG